MVSVHWRRRSRQKVSSSSTTHSTHTLHSTHATNYCSVVVVLHRLHSIFTPSLTIFTLSLTIFTLSSPTSYHDFAQHLQHRPLAGGRILVQLLIAASAQQNACSLSDLSVRVHKPNAWIVGLQQGLQNRVMGCATAETKVYIVLVKEERVERRMKRRRKKKEERRKKKEERRKKKEE
jgi:hypothetical protein